MNVKKAVLPSLAVLVLMGCDAATDAVSDSISDSIVEAVSPDPVTEASDLLIENDPAVCANEYALQAALEAAWPQFVAGSDYKTYLDSGGQPVRVDTISATAIDPHIHEVTCSSKLHGMRMKFDGEDEETSSGFRFKLRPALDNGSKGIIAIARSNNLLLVHARWGKEQLRVQQELQSTSSDFPDDCSFVIRGQQMGGPKCRTVETEEGTQLVSNDAGTVILRPNLLSDDNWTVSWEPRDKSIERSTTSTDECIKSEITTTNGKFAFC